MLAIDKRAGPAGETVLVLVGPIDAAADLAAVASVRAGTLVLDLGGVTWIDSVGVREWIRVMRAIPSDVTVAWINASVAMVSQMAMIANFHGHSRIESFYAPWFCDACDEEHQTLLTPGQIAPDGMAPPMSCPACGGVLEFDQAEPDYLGAVWTAWTERAETRAP